MRWVKESQNMALQLPFVILLRNTQNYLSNNKPVYKDLKTCINLTVSNEEPLMLLYRLKFKNFHTEK